MIARNSPGPLFPFTAASSLVLVALIVPTIGSWSPALAMQAMTKKHMSKVTGREGLVLDMNVKAHLEKAEFRDSNGYTTGSGNGVLRIGDGAGDITLGDGSGNPGDLLGTTLNLDGTDDGRVVVSLPTGSLDVSLPRINVVDQFSSPGGSTVFGDVYVSGFSPGSADGNDLRLSAKATGLRFNFGSATEESGEINLGNWQYEDPDGTGGNSGTMSLGDLRIHDTEYSNWHFEGFGIDSDYSKGLVFSVSNSGEEDDLGVTTDFRINGNTLFRYKMGGGDGGIVPRGSRLEITGTGDGLRVTPVVRVDAIDRTRILDPDGFGSSGGSDLRTEGLQVGDVFGVSGVDPANLGPHTVDLDSSGGIVLTAPGRSTSITPLDVSIPPPTVDSSGPTLKVDLSDLDWRGSRLGLVEGGTNGSGISLNLQLQLTLNEIRFTDTDGIGGSQSGFFSLGYRGSGEGITIDDGSGNPADLSGMKLDVDPSQGIVLSVPDGVSNFGNVSAVIEKATLGDASTELGSFDARKMNFQGSTVRIDAH